MIAGILLLAGVLGAPAQKTADAPYSVIAGTVFQDSGLALPGAEVAIDPEASQKPKPKIRIKRLQANSRGEFAFRLPPGPAKYVVRAKGPGFQEDEKTVPVAGDERVDVFFTLKPLPRK